MKLSHALAAVLPGLVALGACWRPAPPVVADESPPPSATGPSSSPVAEASAATSSSASPAASAPVVASSAPAASALVLPPAPPPTVAEGAAAIVWVEDPKADDSVRSTWIEPDGAGAKIVAQRSGMVFVGRRELWALARREVKIKNAKCDDPGTVCNDGSGMIEPYLRSLASGRAQSSPWRREIRESFGCAHTADVMIDGSVGPFAFSKVWLTDVGCGSTCPIHRGSFTTFDVDTGRQVSLAFPAPIVAPLRGYLLASGASFFEVCPTLPVRRATGAYNARGLLEGIFEFGDDQSGLCAGASMCPNPSERVAWVPEKLAPWSKLPAWVASFLATTKAETALMIPAARLDASRKQFER
jgi:hypothetical protein